MKKIIVNENWDETEIIDASDLFVLIFKQGSNLAAYIKDYGIDELEMLTKYRQLLTQYKDVKFEDPTSIILVKLPTTSQVKSMLAEAEYAGDETNPTKIEIINYLLDRADCEYIKEKVLMSLEEAKKKKKKKRTPKVTYTMGFPFLNDQRFNHAFGSCDCNKDNDNLSSDATSGGDVGAGDSSGSSAGGEGGAMGESLNEALTPLQKMQELENGTRGFNAAAASDQKLLDNLLICAKNNLPNAAVVVITEIQRRMNRGVWTLGPLPGFNNPSQASTMPSTSTNPNTIVLTFEPSDFSLLDLDLIEKNQARPDLLIGAVENYNNPLHWAIVLIVLASSAGYSKMTALLKEWILKSLPKETFKQIISQIKQNPDIISKVAAICNKELSEGVKMNKLTEAKRYVKRYYIRPQNIFCSNKAEILNALVKEVGENNCSVYSLKALDDHDDVHLLQPKDIIYYYDDGILYDKNHVKVMDYDLNVKHEEERRRFGNIDAVADETFAAEYEDRLTESLDDFYVDFEDINAYGIRLREGREIEYTCCICGEDFEGYGNNPAPYKTSGKCCDACNRKFIIPARLAQLADED